MSDEKININNLREEIEENLEHCIKCGNCKSLCPIFKALKEESYSPRGKCVMLSNKIFDKFVYECTLCRACEHECTLNLKICDSIRKARQVINNKTKEEFD
ncbi:MAG: 4Fe-4S dicluster domain-containing protein [Nanoarchaeota archaeon]